MLKYTLEKFVNIKTFQLIVFCQSQEAPLIKLTASTIEVSWSGELFLTLDNEVDTSNCTSCMNSDSLEVKMPFLNTNNVKNELDQRLLSVHEANKLCCRGCQNHIIVGNDPSHLITKVMSLPSSHWLELSDMWLCLCCAGASKHTHDHKHKSLPFPQQEIQAKTNCCLVGDTFILLHKSNVQGLKIAGDKNAAHEVSYGHKMDGDLWTSVVCSSCNAPLGMVQTDGEKRVVDNAVKCMEVETLFNFKLFKHKLYSLQTSGCSMYDHPFRYRV